MNWNFTYYASGILGHTGFTLVLFSPLLPPLQCIEVPYITL